MFEVLENSYYYKVFEILGNLLYYCKFGNFVRKLFSQIAFKDIFAALKIAARV